MFKQVDFMKTNVFLSMLLLCAVMPLHAAESKILEQKQGSITFVVDSNLPEPKNTHIIPIVTQAERLKSLGNNYYSLENSFIAASFWDTPMNNTDAPFFNGMVAAFADHRPVSLSPDVVWMLVSQAFSQEVNADPKRFRNLFVDFDGKTDLVVQSDKKLLDPSFDWTAVIDGFAQQIDSCTKGDAARSLIADFSTTGTVERMASEIVLMETTKAFFEYIVMRISCGIPSVTLTGTVQDWQRVLDKTSGLTDMGAGSWVTDLIPVLKQFVQAADGHPDQTFWRNMVMLETPERLQGGNCSNEPVTKLDGWFLKLLPFDKDGKPAPATVPHNAAIFPKEMASVPVKYVEVNPQNAQIDNVVNLKCSGGIVGFTADPETGCISFPVGWAVSKSDDDSMEERFQKNSSYLSLRVKQMPELLRSVSEYGTLMLELVGDVAIPEWFYDLKIEQHLVITGKLPADVRKRLNERFGNRVTFRK